MAALDYAEILEVVVELIADTGRDCTFERLSATPADPDKPWRGPAAPTVAASVVTPATFVPPSGTEFGKGWVTDEMLQRCSQVCLVAASPLFELDDTTSITDAGVRWRVEWAYVLRPGLTTLLYAFGVRR